MGRNIEKGGASKKWKSVGGARHEMPRKIGTDFVRSISCILTRIVGLQIKLPPAIEGGNTVAESSKAVEEKEKGKKKLKVKGKGKERAKEVEVREVEDEDEDLDKCAAR